MKLTQKQLLDLASALGLEGVEVVENETDSDFDNNAALSAIDGSRRKILEPLIKSELEGELKASIEGKHNGAIRAMLARASGLSHSQLKKLESSSLEDAIKAAFDHSKSSLEGDQQATAQKIEEMLNAHNDALTAKETEWKGKYDELNNKYISRDMLDVFMGKLKDAPLPEKLDRNIAAKDFMNHLREKYHLSYDEAKRTVDLMDKTNPSMPALNEAKNAQIDIMAEAKSFFEPRAAWVTDMRGKNPADAMQGKGQPMTNPAIAGRPTSAQAQREARLQGYEQQGGL